MKKAAILYSGARNWGGVETYLFNLLSEGNNSVEFYFLSMGEWELGKKLSPILGKRVINLPGARFSPSLLFIKLPKILKENNIDTLVSQGVVANAYARVVSLISSVPQITIVHSVLKAEYKNSLIRFFYSSSDLIMRWRTRKFICVSEYIKSVLIKGGVSAKKIVVIHNGVKLGLKTANSKRPTANGKFIIGSIGRLSHEKGYDILIEVAKDLPENIEIHLCGEGSEREKLIALIRENKLKDKVKFINFMENLDGFYNNVDLYIQPSRSEGFGLGVAEAMVRGIPVLVSDVGALPEVVEDRRFVYTQDTILEKIWWAIQNIESLKKEAVQNIEKSKKRFDVKVWKEKTIEEIANI